MCYLCRDIVWLWLLPLSFKSEGDELGQFNLGNGGGGGAWGGWDWWKSQAAIKGEKMKWHLTLLDAGDWRAATEVQSSLGTCENREGREIRPAEHWGVGRGDGPGNLTLPFHYWFSKGPQGGQKLLQWQNQSISGKTNKKKQGFLFHVLNMV